MTNHVVLNFLRWTQFSTLNIVVTDSLFSLTMKASILGLRRPCRELTVDAMFSIEPIFILVSFSTNMFQLLNLTLKSQKTKLTKSNYMQLRAGS